ncbi:MAG: type II toxin-antitoxin system PemK/MazF family toxin [Candidatus Absconditabacteria bacterium]|nr:type II toxin-antitoxin system PemK/MazF family toxin [Candidatus Absconditabacteria bacterium]MDD3262227.1 type II toxin-antitoxin system PemK/MazF family toxin [Candidatus Absconditabacteria bacterium]
MKKTDVIFDLWNGKKKNIEKETSKKIVKKRQIRLYYVGINVGNEESKDNPFIRPCLIVNNYFRGDLVLIVPMTTKINTNLKDIYYQIDGTKYGLNKTSYVLCNQIKVISKKRLNRKLNDTDDISLLNNDVFLEIIEKLKSFI